MRKAGVLLGVSSLPSAYGIGDFGESCYRLVDLLKTLYMPFVNTANSAVGIFKTLGLLFTDKSVNIDDFSGPVGIFQLVTSTASSGFLSLLSLTAFLSKYKNPCLLIVLPWLFKKILSHK